jgi:hypothetical protein
MIIRDGMPHLERLALDVRAWRRWTLAVRHVGGRGNIPALCQLELRFELGSSVPNGDGGDANGWVSRGADRDGDAAPPTGVGRAALPSGPGWLFWDWKAGGLVEALLDELCV